MHTYRGTSYAMLRTLAGHGVAPSRKDCEVAEREGRCMHAHQWREHAMQALLIARALWSAWRAGQRAGCV